ncbi:MAG TPA: zinc-ribbon domain containing protein [Ardenticatenaceae bacterium]|jgi:CxxC-x17-CxxC domain-containing protein
MQQVQDRTLTCRDCGNSFVFTQGEQEFFTMKGFSEPTRCPSCRQARKRERNGSGGISYSSSSPAGSYSDSYTQPSSYSGAGYGESSEHSSYGSSGGYGESRERMLYDATCENCGVATKVPFKPRGIRPVYCRDCYNSRR